MADRFVRFVDYHEVEILKGFFYQQANTRYAAEDSIEDKGSLNLITQR